MLSLLSILEVAKNSQVRVVSSKNVDKAIEAQAKQWSSRRNVCI